MMSRVSKRVFIWRVRFANAESLDLWRGLGYVLSAGAFIHASNTALFLPMFSPYFLSFSFVGGVKEIDEMVELFVFSGSSIREQSR